ncbi:MAG: flavodoxin domain-containing protein, partial [Dehalococcoidales bacterium]|nr:flavodoxin domain-containing protein [Dehalococcoidales bacterium]
MLVLVAYASKYGATREIAERIAEELRSAGHGVEVRSVKSAGDLAGYEAFVIGSAVYFGHWLKEAAEFVRRNRAVLVDRPVWLFSCG